MSMIRSYDGDSKQGMLLHVCAAMDGVVHAIHLTNDTGSSVHAIQQSIEQKTKVPREEQILLVGPPFARLDPRKPLSSYGLPSTKKQIFLYDRRALSPTAAQPGHIILQPQHIQVPQEPSQESTTNSRLLTESTNPLVKALVDYERQFLLQTEQRKVLGAGADARIKACQDCIQEQKNQEQAVNAAILNLESFQVALSKRFDLFLKDYRIMQENHEQLLSSFDQDLGKLEAIKLHPALSTRERSSLLDCIPLEKEKQWAKACALSLGHLNAKVNELVSLHAQVRDGVNNALMTSLSEDESSRDAHLVHLKQQVEKQKEFEKRFTSNYMTVGLRIQETTQYMSMSTGQANPGNSAMFASTNILEVCKGFAELWNEQGALIAEMTALDVQLQTFMEQVALSKTNMTQKVLEQLYKVAVLQSHIRDLGNNLSIVKEAAMEQSRYFAELEHLRKLPDAYKSCLSEIVRRRRFGAEFANKIQSVGEQLAKSREIEMEKRAVFLREYGRHLPRDFVPGLLEKPSHCEIRMHPFDKSLPLIDDEGLLMDEKSSESSLNDDLESKDQGSLLLEANPEWAPGGSDRNLKQHCEKLEEKIIQLQLDLQKKDFQLQSQAAIAIAVAGQPAGSSTKDASSDSSANFNPTATTTPGTLSSSTGFPILMAFAEAAEMTQNETERSTPVNVTSSEMQDECQRAIQKAQVLASKMEELEKTLCEERMAMKLRDEQWDIRLQIKDSNLDEKNIKIQELERQWVEALGATENLSASLQEKQVLLQKLDEEHQKSLLNASSFEEDIQAYERKLQQQEEMYQKLTLQHQQDMEDHVKDLGIIFQWYLDHFPDFEGKPTLEEWKSQGFQYSKESWQLGMERLQHFYSHRLAASMQADFCETNKCKADLEASIHVKDEHILDLYDQLQLVHHSKISFRGFEVDDLALFLPTTSPSTTGRIYLAFHVGCPNRYLSDESIASCRKAGNQLPAFIVGKIVFITEERATEDFNPYSLGLGTKFYVLTAESITE